MGALKQISVTLLKAKLLEIVRHVEQGESFEITKDGKKVGLLCPSQGLSVNACGFSKIEILGDLLSPLDEEWSFDSTNLKKEKKKHARST